MGKINVEMYVLKYTGITEALVKRNALSKFDRNVSFLEGLSDDVQLKVFEYSREKGWRMLEHNLPAMTPIACSATSRTDDRAFNPSAYGWKSQLIFINHHQEILVSTCECGSVYQKLYYKRPTDFELAIFVMRSLLTK